MMESMRHPCQRRMPEKCERRRAAFVMADAEAQADESLKRPEWFCHLQRRFPTGLPPARCHALIAHHASCPILWSQTPHVQVVCWRTSSNGSGVPFATHRGGRRANSGGTAREEMRKRTKSFTRKSAAGGTQEIPGYRVQRRVACLLRGASAQIVLCVLFARHTRRRLVQSQCVRQPGACATVVWNVTSVDAVPRGAPNQPRAYGARARMPACSAPHSTSSPFHDAEGI